LIYNWSENMARRIVRTSYTIDTPTFNYDLMLPIWKTFANSDDPTCKPFLYRNTENPKPELITGLDPNVETLLIININVTAGTFVGGGSMSVNPSYGTNRYWDPQRNVYRNSRDVNTYEYDKLTPTDDYGWAGPRGLQANFYENAVTFRFNRGDASVLSRGVGIDGAVHHLSSFGRTSPAYEGLVADNANNWIVKFPCVGTVSAENVTGQPGIEPDNKDSVVTHEPFPGMNHLGSMAAMLIGVPPSDKWKVQINIKNAGTICGFGGGGGRGAYTAVDTAENRYRVLGRNYLPSDVDGANGGDAIDCRAGQDPSKSYPSDWIKVNVINIGSGRILAGGGGGGGGGYDWRRTTNASLNDTVLPSGAGGGGAAGAGLNLWNFYYYWINNPAEAASLAQTYRKVGAPDAYTPIPQWSLGGSPGSYGYAPETFRLAGQSNGIPAGGAVYQGNYNGSPGGMGKDPITNDISYSAGGQGGAKAAGGPGGHQTYSGGGYTQDLGKTAWYPGGNKGGDGGDGGDYASSGEAGQEPIGSRTPSPTLTYGTDRFWYGAPGRAGAPGRLVVYSDNVTVNVKSVRPRNVKGTKTKIDPV
jgi:hypothetical protein